MSSINSNLGLFFRLATMCSIGGMAVEGSTDEVGNMPKCIYKAPTQEAHGRNFLHELISFGNDVNETFAGIHRAFVQNSSFFHQFVFKYPLKDREHAQAFAKVLQIKAQEAHRFVPVITHSQFETPSHLGFTRTITIENEGPTIQEHVLVDRGSNSVIFIEEWVETKMGKEPGHFSALNQVIEENGQWYFAGTYLYDDNPGEQEIKDRIEMFDKTYENMVDFIAAEDYEAVFRSLKEF